MGRRTVTWGKVAGVVAIVLLLFVGTSLGSLHPSTLATRGALRAVPPVDPPVAAAPSVTPSLGIPSAVTLNWTNLSIPDSKSPPPRANGNMVWESFDGYGLLFGGEYYNVTSSQEVYYNDTWTYLSGVWTNVTPVHSPSPSPREGAAMADYSAGNEVVLFGGESHDHSLNDTWVWAAGKWTNISGTAGAAPPAGYWASMTYDPAIAGVVLFGGLNVTAQDGNDTWLFEGGAWAQLHPTVLPPGRQGQEMVYDGADGEIVMFGGNGRVVYQNDTWTYSGSNWAPIAPGNHPGARTNPGLVYDPNPGDVVLFGGQPAPLDYYSTWLFHGGTWTQYNLSWNPPNPQDIASQMIYDPTDDCVFLFYEQDAYGPVVQNWALSLTSGTSAVQASLAARPATLALGQTSNLTTTASGGTGPYTYAYSTLPAGCTSQNLSPLPCTPSTVGDYVVGVNVTDTGSGHAAAVGTLDVTASASTLTASLTADPSTVVVNQSVTLTVTTGGIPAASLTYGYTALPPGCISVDAATLACSPNEIGTYSPQVEVHDSAGHFANASTTLTVTTASGSSGPTTSLWVEIVLAVVVVVALFLLVGALRRGRKRPPPAPAYSPPPPPTPPPPPA